MHPVHIYLITMLPACTIAVMAHELGHAVAGTLVGFQVTSVGLGGPQDLTSVAFSFGRTRVFFGRHGLFSGVTYVQPRKMFLTPNARRAFIAGGSLANLILGIAGGVIAWASWDSAIGLVVGVVSFFNLVTAAEFLLPFTWMFGTIPIRSDGALFWQTFREDSGLDAADQTIRDCELLRPFFTRVRDFDSLRAQLRAAALAWVTLGRTDEAERLCDEADSLPLPDGLGEILPGFRELARSVVASARHDATRAEILLSQAVEAMTRNGDRDGAEFLGICREEWDVQRNPTPELCDRLEAKASGPIPSRVPALRRELLLTLLAARKKLGQEDQVARLTEIFGRTCKLPETLGMRFRVALAEARTAAAQRDAVAAERAYRKLLEAVRECVQIPLTEPGRLAMRDRYEDLIAEASAWLPDAAEVVDRPLDPPSDPKPLPAWARPETWIRWAIRWNLCLLGIGLVVALSSLLVETERESWLRLFEAGFCFAIAGFTLAVGGVHWLLERTLCISSKGRAWMLSLFSAIGAVGLLASIAAWIALQFR